MTAKHNSTTTDSMTTLKLRILFWIALSLSCAVRPPEAPIDSPIDGVLESSIKSGRVPGVVGIAASRDQILYQGAFGKKDLASAAPMQLDTIFAIASMTKPITSVAVMQLVEQGTVKLDASIAQYLPELADPQVLEGFDEDGNPRLRDAARPPTIRELLSNTSGYAYSIWNDDIRRYEAEANLPGGRDKFAQLPLASDPGTRWEYSPSTDVLGMLVETLSGLTLEQYFQQNIFATLGMEDTFFQVPAEKWSRVSSRHIRQTDGSYDVSDPLPAEPPIVSFYSGGGGLMSTAPDYIRFVRALLNGGGLDGARILEPQTVDLMAQNQIGEFEAGEMITFVPNLSNDVNLFPGAEDKFGLGFLINSEPVTGGRARGSLMWAGLYNTYFWIDREHGVGGVVLTQMLPFADTTVLGLLEEFEKAFYGEHR
jgi:methyl acetate hydrolase